MDRKPHWENIYEKKADQDVSWFEPLPAMSLRMLDAAGMTPDSCIVDVGGGSSQLIDRLLERGVRCLTVLDVSGAALRRTQARLGQAAASVNWIESDVTADWSIEPVDIWHDRAVFHFLNSAVDRERYRMQLLRVLKIQGTAIVATFAADGPETCSGLPVMRFSAESLAFELGPRFRLVESVRHEHRTPRGVVQPFTYARFRRQE
jgi:ubiquinone/menaquinone biosynthesis C-methylase UbiE